MDEEELLTEKPRLSPGMILISARITRLDFERWLRRKRRAERALDERSLAKLKVPYEPEPAPRDPWAGKPAWLVEILKAARNGGADDA